MAKKCGALRIESTCQKIESDAPAIFPQRFRIAQTGERMVIGDKVKRFALGLERNRRLHHPKIIADVQHAAGLDAGKNAHGTN